MQLEISHSSCSMARQCPMKYYWKYIMGYKPILKPISMALGSIVHEAFDMYYKGFTSMETDKFIRDTMAQQIAEVSLPDQEDLQIVKYTALGMWNYYPNKNLSAYDEIKSEKEFKVKIDGMRNVLFVGKTDRLIKFNGKWWIGELKTTGLPFSVFKNRMNVTDQVTAYTYAWRKLGYPVQGCLFDYIKKPLLRKGVNETCQDFSHRIFMDYKSRPKEYFNRHFEYRSDDDIKRWLKDTKTLIKTIRNIRKGIVYRNPDSCWNYNAECPYKKICFTDKPDQLTLNLYFENTWQKAPQKGL